MKTKRILGAITAIAMSASAFAGLGCVASAETYESAVDVSAFVIGSTHHSKSYDTESGVESITNSSGNSPYEWAKLDLTTYYNSLKTSDETVTSVTVSYKETISSSGRTRIGFYDNDVATYPTTSYNVSDGSAIGYGLVGENTTRVFYYDDSSKTSSNASYYGTSKISLDSEESVSLVFDLQEKTITGTIGEYTVNSYIPSDIDSIDTLAFQSWSATTYKISDMTISFETTTEKYYDITINYYDEADPETLVKYETDSATAGDYTYTYETSFNQDGKKYTYVSGGDTVTISGATVINLYYSSRDLVDTNYTLTAVLGEATKTLASGTVTEDSTIYNVPYPEHIIGDDGVLYSISQEYFTSGKYFAVDVTGTQEDQEIKVTYTAGEDTPVYYAEMEDVLENNNVSNAAVRCSNGAGGDVSTSQTITRLTPGTYTITTAAWGGSNKGDSYNSTYAITVGDNTAVTVTTTGSWTKDVKGTEFEITENTDVVVTKTVTGSSSACLDFVLITGTGSVAPIITSASAVTAVAAEPETTATLNYVENGEATDTTTLDKLVEDVGSTYVTTYTIKVANYASGLPTLYFDPEDENAGESLTPTEINNGKNYYYELSDGTCCFIIQTIGIDTAAKVSIAGATTVEVETDES